MKNIKTILTQTKRSIASSTQRKPKPINNKSKEQNTGDDDLSRMSTCSAADMLKLLDGDEQEDEELNSDMNLNLAEQRKKVVYEESNVAQAPQEVAVEEVVKLREELQEAQQEKYEQFGGKLFGKLDAAFDL